MKKYIIFLFSALLVFMVACSDEGESDDEIDDDLNQEESHPDDGKTSAEIQEGIIAKQGNPELEEDVNTEVLDVKYYNWIDEAVDEEAITVYAEVKNTSNVNIVVDYVDVTYLDSSGNVIAVNEAYVSPSQLKEGSIGYLVTEVEDDIERFDDLNEVELKVSATHFDYGEITDLNVIDDNLNVETWGEKSAQISVTGFLKNESDVDFSADDTNAMIGLYDKNNNFLAAELMYSDQEFSIDSNDKTSFEFGGGRPLPPEVKEKTDHAKINVIGIEFEDEAY